MAQKKEDAKAGFKIPIEDASDEAAVGAAEVAEPAEPEEVEAEAAEEPAVADEAKAAEPAEESEVAEEGQAVEGDIVAEAEAVLDKVAAAAADALEKARQEASDWQDRYLRLHAEWDTYRRRTTEQRAEEKARANEKLVENLLPVLDDFERSISYATENGETGLLEGVKAVQSKLIGVLEKSGVVIIDPAGEPFDALESQAVGTVPDEEAYDETVRDVYQKGYKMGKKVIRPAMVTVTTGGPQRPKDEAGTEE